MIVLYWEARTMIDKGDANMLMRENTLRKPTNIFRSGCFINSYVTNTIEVNITITNKSSATVLTYHLKKAKINYTDHFLKNIFFHERICILATTIVKPWTSAEPIKYSSCCTWISQYKSNHLYMLFMCVCVGNVYPRYII